MFFWGTITVACIIVALLIQYLCSSKLLRLKQDISIKTRALRQVREEEQQLDERENEIKNQQSILDRGIARLRVDIKRLRGQLNEKGLPVPDANFPLEEFEDTISDEE